MSNEQERPANSKMNGKQTAGLVLLWAGFVLLVIGIFFAVVSSMLSGPMPEEMARVATTLAAFGAFGISCLFLLVGVILYFIGGSQAKKQKNEKLPGGTF